MSIMSVNLIMERIKFASPDSPIAVFRCGVEGKLDAVFADTVITRYWIRDGVKPLVGIYDRRADLKKLHNFLTGLVGVSVGDEVTADECEG